VYAIQSLEFAQKLWNEPAKVGRRKSFPQDRAYNWVGDARGFLQIELSEQPIEIVEPVRIESDYLILEHQNSEPPDSPGGSRSLPCNGEEFQTKAGVVALLSQKLFDQVMRLMYIIELRCEKFE
jgi:hypothetical protein